MFFVGAAIEEVLHAFAAWAPTMPEEVTTSVALLRLPPIDDVPPPLRGVVSLALRFGFTGPAERGDALLAPMRKVAAPLLDSVGPMSYAAVDSIHMDPTEPMPAVARGGLLHSMPAELLDTLLEVAGPDVEVPLAVVELRLMGGALGRPAAVPNAVAGRDGAFSLSVVAPAPPPMAGRRARGDGSGDGRPGAMVDGHVAGQLRRPWWRVGGAERVDTGRARTAASGEDVGGSPESCSVAGSPPPQQ